MIGHVIEVLKESVVYCVDVLFTTERLALACIENDLEAKYDVYMKGGPIIGPITYFGNPAIIDVLKDEPDMQPFGEGLLLRLTDDIANAERPEIVARLHAIRCKLLDAGIKSLEQGINRAEWGCDGSSVLQGEPEFQ